MKNTGVKGYLSIIIQYDETQRKLCKLVWMILNIFRANAESLGNITFPVEE